MQKINVEKINEFAGHKDAVYALISGPAEGDFFSAGGDGNIVLWNVNKPDSPGLVVAKFPAAIYSLIYLKEENCLLAGARYGNLFYLNLNTHKQEKALDLAGDIFALLLHENKLFAACAGGHLYAIDLKHFSIKRYMQPSRENGRSLAFDPKAKTLACGFSDGFIRLYDADTLEGKNAWFAHEKSVFALKYLPDGRLLSGGRDAQVRVWSENISGLAERTIPAHMFTINKIIFSPSKKCFVTASRDKTFKIWDAETLDLLKVIERPKFASHTHSVNTALWINENMLLTAGDDRRIRIWKLNFFDKQD